MSGRGERKGRAVPIAAHFGFSFFVARYKDRVRRFFARRYI